MSFVILLFLSVMTITFSSPGIKRLALLFCDAGFLRDTLCHVRRRAHTPESPMQTIVTDMLQNSLQCTVYLCFKPFYSLMMLHLQFDLDNFARGWTVGQLYVLHVYIAPLLLRFSDGLVCRNHRDEAFLSRTNMDYSTFTTDMLDVM